MLQGREDDGKMTTYRNQQRRPRNGRSDQVSDVKCQIWQSGGYRGKTVSVEWAQVRTGKGNVEKTQAPLGAFYFLKNRN